MAEEQVDRTMSPCPAYLAKGGAKRTVPTKARYGGRGKPAGLIHLFPVVGRPGENRLDRAVGTFGERKDAEALACCAAVHSPA